MEVLLVHEDKGGKLPPVWRRLLVQSRKLDWSFQFRLDSTASQFVSGRAAEDQDFDTDFNMS